MQPEANKELPRNQAGASGSLGKWIAAGFILGIACGVFFGEYCKALDWIGLAYVGLLQMTVLPYLVVALTANMARIEVGQARRLGLILPAVLIALWCIGVILITGVSGILPEIQGSSFYSGGQGVADEGANDYLIRFIPFNVFHSLSEEYVPAIVVFFMAFGASLMLVPQKEKLLEVLDVCNAGIGKINHALVRGAPVGLFALTASAAGTLRLEELSRLQAYLIMLVLVCGVAALVILPAFVACLTRIRVRDFMVAAQEPLLTALITGKLFVVLPQVEQQCGDLIQAAKSRRGSRGRAKRRDSVVGIVVPLAYTLPHLGKILVFVFISFAGWYSGQELSTGETVEMAASGVVSSFASPMVSIPFLLDRYQLPQDLLYLFILPGFITMRLGDAVGVMHLMAVTVVSNEALEGRLRIRYGRLVGSAACILIGFVIVGAAGRAYLSSTTRSYRLDDRLLTLALPESHDRVSVRVIGESAADVQPNRSPDVSTLAWIGESRRLRVGFRPDRLPYSYFNAQGDLVGMDVELMHQLAASLDLELEFVPYTYASLVDQLNAGDFDVAIGGLIISPSRLLRAGFTESYDTATFALVTPDYRRTMFSEWEQLKKAPYQTIGVVQDDLLTAARRFFPGMNVVLIDSPRTYFEHRKDGLSGILMTTEEAAAWNILYPEFAVVVPKPVINRTVGMMVRQGDQDWRRFLDRWLELEQMEGAIERLREYWVLGGGATQQSRRWSVVQDVLGWLP